MINTRKRAVALSEDKFNKMERLPEEEEVVVAAP